MCRISLLVRFSYQMKFEWLQTSSGLEDSSQYSSRSQQWYSLVSFDSSTDFQFLDSLLLRTVPSVPTTIGITLILMFHRFFSSLARSYYQYDYYFAPCEFFTTDLLKSPEFFSVFKPVLTRLWFEWSLFFLWFTTPLVFFQPFEGCF